MMKKTFRTSILSTAFAFSCNLLQASDNFAEGDLAVVFYSAKGTGTSTVIAQDYYVFNLGPASLYRENTQNNVSVSTINPSISGNIASDLNSAFGSTWAENPEVRWFVVGMVSQTGPLTSGDPFKTTYLSVRRASLDTGSTGTDTATPNFPATISSSNRTGLTNNIDTFLRTGVNNGISNPGASTGSYTSTPGANPSGVILPTTNLINLKGYVPNNSGTTLFFTLSHNPTQTFTVGALPGSAGVQGALDIFRTLNLTVPDPGNGIFPDPGTDYTAGASSGNAVEGIGQYIGALTIDSSGNLKIQGVGAAAGSYATWSTANGVTGGANGDSDNDGISNLVEYALNLNFAASDGSAGTYSGDLLTFNKRPEAVTNNDVSYDIQESDDLGISDPWQTATPTSNTTTAITYSLSHVPGTSRKFARLVVKSTP